MSPKAVIHKLMEIHGTARRCITLDSDNLKLYVCPSCKTVAHIAPPDSITQCPNYCSNCGQKLKVPKK